MNYNLIFGYSFIGSMLDPIEKVGRFGYFLVLTTYIQ